MSASKRPLSPAGNSGKRQCMTPDVIAIDPKGDAILCIGTPVAAMLRISSDTLATSSLVLKAMLDDGDSSEGRHRSSESPREITILDNPETSMLLCGHSSGITLPRGTPRSLVYTVGKYKVIRDSKLTPPQFVKSKTAANLNIGVK